MVKNTRHTSHTLADDTVDSWLRMIAAAKRRGWQPGLTRIECAQPRERLVLDVEVRLGSDLTLPAGTEVVFYCLFPAERRRICNLQIEGTFYLPGTSTTISIIGTYGRRKLKAWTKAAHDRKTMRVKTNSAPRRVTAFPVQDGEQARAQARTAAAARLAAAKAKTAASAL